MTTTYGGYTLGELRDLIARATPQAIDTSEIKDDDLYECPWCNGQGDVEGATYMNYDDVASNVQFSGIGPEFGHAEALFRALVKAAPDLLISLSQASASAERQAERIRVLEAMLERVSRLNSFRELNGILWEVRQLIGIPWPPTNDAS